MWSKKSDKALWWIILKFFITSFVLVGLIIHELGHILMQAILGLPFCLSFVWPIGPSTTYGCLNLSSLPPPTAIVILFAGLAAMLAAYRIDIIKEMFMSKDIKKNIIDKEYRIYFDKQFQRLRFLLYLAVCLGFASHDISAVFRILFGT